MSINEKNKNIFMSASSGASKKSNETIINIADIKDRQDLAENKQQLLNRNYYSYSPGQSILPASTSKSSLYVYLENNTTRDILVYPGQVAAITTSPSTDIFLTVVRLENPIVDISGLTSLTSRNLGDLFAGPPIESLEVYYPSDTEIISEGTIIKELTSFVINGAATNEEERGERYILKQGEKILAKITNNVDKELNIYVKSYWSFL